MTSNLLLTAIAAAAVLASGSALAARDHSATDSARHRAANGTCGDDARGDHHDAHGHHVHERHEARAALRVVPNASLPDQPSYGWQYFSNPRARAAVVISPAGEYFLNRGEGLRQITGPAGDVLATAQAQN